jgi:hypothetical protein
MVTDETRASRKNGMTQKLAYLLRFRLLLC